MSDSQWKSKKLAGLAPAFPAIGGLSANTLMRWSPLRAALEAQDHVPAQSRRVLAEYSLSGSDEWECPDDTAGDPNNAGGAQLYPGGTWRTVGTFWSKLTPGCQLEAHVTFAPAGTVQKDTGGGFWIHDGAWAEFRAAVTWYHSGGSTGPHYFAIAMSGSGLGAYGGGEQTDPAAEWGALDEKWLEGIRPPAFDGTSATAELYSEDADVRIVLQQRGGARVVHATVSEVPYWHVQAHNDAGDVCVVGMPAGTAPLMPLPQEDPADGATYQENRWGLTRMVQVANRQAERLGPRPLHITCYDASANEWDQTDPTPWTVTSTSFVELDNSTVTAYDADFAAYCVAGAHAKLHRLAEPLLISRDEHNTIPVRVHLDAEKSGAGAATVRVQAGPYSWVDLTVASGARAHYEVVGYLRSQVHADDSAGALQIFARVASGGTLSVHGISIDYGQHASHT